MRLCVNRTACERGGGAVKLGSPPAPKEQPGNNVFRIVDAALPIIFHVISARGGGRATATRIYTFVNKATWKRYETFRLLVEKT